MMLCPHCGEAFDPAGPLGVTLTPRQLDVYEYVVSFREAAGFSPTLEEIGTALSLSRVTVHEHIENLVKKGLFVKKPHARRNILPAR